MAGGQSPRRRTSLVTAQEVEFEADPADLEKGSVDEDTPELFFCDDLAGYGWCFRKGNFLNIGLGRVDCRDVPQQMTDFYDFLRERKKVLAPLPERRHGHSYYLYEGPPQPMVDDALLLVGDAAGLAYAQSGEGILPAVESGLMAADVIRSAAASGAYTRDSLEPYAERVRNRFGVPRQNSLTQRLPVSWLQKTAASLLATRWFSRHVLLNRWFLHC